MSILAGKLHNMSIHQKSHSRHTHKHQSCVCISASTLREIGRETSLRWPAKCSIKKLHLRTISCMTL
uniref:Uncharacterized protein n=1 Tax=Arundo donax TaxID=35708 RepID=A0A0A9DCM0_ARUDO